MRNDEILLATQDLVTAVRMIFEVELLKNTNAAPALKRILDLLPHLKPDPDRPDASQKPVCRHFPHALELGENSLTAAIARAIRRLEPIISWKQTSHYNAENMGAHFMDNYAWSELGLKSTAGLDFGAMLLGPEVTYPLTSYAQEGIFLVIGGSPNWKLEDGPWTQVEEGNIIWRPADGAEGKRTGKEPMLALFAWL